MKTALVHDWLTGMRGGEKVLAELVQLMPQADIFTLVWKPGSVSSEIEARVRGVSFLQRLPHCATAYRAYLPLFPAAIRSFDLSGYDLIVSSSHAVAKSVRAPAGSLHLSYVHTPMRYIWHARRDYFRFGRGRIVKKAALAAVCPWLRRFDVRTAADVHFYIANSQNVRDRIRHLYGRDAEVVYPPVDTEYFTPGAANSGGYYLAAGALEPYKRVDLVIKAFAGGSRRLIVAGRGSLSRDLRRIVRSPVEFEGEVSDARLRELYRGCRALVFAGLEDFGMVLVEAQACGRPVICFGGGGAREAVVAGRTGLHFHEQSEAALLRAVERFESMSWDAGAIRAHSLKFSSERFRESMTSLLEGFRCAGFHLAGRFPISVPLQRIKAAG
jgi:glycosyltransferase involved in cell wall biosynthesis